MLTDCQLPEAENRFRKVQNRSHVLIILYHACEMCAVRYYMLQWDGTASQTVAKIN